MDPIFLLVAAVVANVFTSLLKSASWSNEAKHLVATCVSFVLSGAAMYLSGGLTVGTDLLQAVLAVHGGSQVFYNLFFRESKVNAKLEATLNK